MTELARVRAEMAAAERRETLACLVWGIVLLFVAGLAIGVAAAAIW